MAEHEEQSGGVPPLDEEAAWAAIVAGYGQEPPDPPGARPFRPIENLLLPEEDVKPLPPESGPPDPKADAKADPKQDPKPDAEAGPPAVLGSSVVFAPGVGMAGPRDHSPAEPKDDDLTPAEEGHFVPRSRSSRRRTRRRSSRGWRSSAARCCCCSRCSCSGR